MHTFYLCRSMCIISKQTKVDNTSKLSISPDHDAPLGSWSSEQIRDAVSSSVMLTWVAGKVRRIHANRVGYLVVSEQGLPSRMGYFFLTTMLGSPWLKRNNATRIYRLDMSSTVVCAVCCLLLLELTYLTTCLSFRPVTTRQSSLEEKESMSMMIRESST